MYYCRIFKIILFTLFFTATKASNIDSLMSDTQVSLITCDPGSDLYSLFGHSAVRVHNVSKKYDVVYNYGTFDFRTPGFMVKFMRGKLPYKLSAYGFDHFLIEYNQDQRGVKEQVLKIDGQEKHKIISFLENNALPENAFYKYDFFYDNCSTRIKDVFENTLGYRPSYVSKEKLTMRDLLHQYLTGSSWTRLGIDMVIGSKADADATPKLQMFLPDKLHDILGNYIYKNKPLLDKSYDVLVFDEQKEKRKIGTFFSPNFFNGILVLLSLVLYSTKRERWLNFLFKLWCILAFAASLIILLLWFATDHQACAMNWNILWLNPFYLLLLFKKFKRRKPLLTILAVLFAISIINTVLVFIPQNMPAYNFTFAFLLVLWKLRVENQTIESQTTV